MNHEDESQSSQKMKILIADDDAPTRILLRAAVSQWNYQAVEAKDGEEAWDIMQKPDAPRLMILDWLMPKLDGVALCERIKKKFSTYYPYIILLTQQTGTTNVIKGLEAGADEFLSKPFNMAELRSRLAVGARIVKYENTLAASDETVKRYTELVKQLNPLLSGLTKQISLLSEFSSQLTSNQNLFLKTINQAEDILKSATDLLLAIENKKDKT